MPCPTASISLSSRYRLRGKDFVAATSNDTVALAPTRAAGRGKQPPATGDCTFEPSSFCQPVRPCREVCKPMVCFGSRAAIAMDGSERQLWGRFESFDPSRQKGRLRRAKGTLSCPLVLSGSQCSAGKRTRHKLATGSFGPHQTMADFCGFGRIDFVAKTTGKDVFFYVFHQ